MNISFIFRVIFLLYFLYLCSFVTVCFVMIYVYDSTVFCYIFQIELLFDFFRIYICNVSYLKKYFIKILKKP